MKPESSAPDPARSISRRQLLAGAAGVAGAAVLGGGGLERLAPPDAGAVPQARVDGGTPGGSIAGADLGETPADLPTGPVRSQGMPPTELGARSPHERIRRTLRGSTTSATPHEMLHGVITPSDLHFERHHAGVPEVDPATWTLLIHGMVERPLLLTLEELKRFPSVSRIRFLECSGNFRTNAPEETPPSLLVPLTSNTEWTGVLLSVLLREVGILPEARWLLAEGSDGALMTRSIPVEKAIEDSMLAWGQNGEPLRPAQGYPVRLFNPGWEGNTSIKWLRRIEVSDRPFMTREETSRYTEKVGDSVRQFSFVMDARSLITAPSYPGRIGAGWHEIRGFAWSGRGRIARVEVSLDDRATWVEAELQEPVLPRAHTRFRLPWRWDGRETAIWSRAIDETGYVQPSQEELIAARGADSGFYHRNPTTGWRIRSDGSVVYRTQEWTA